MLRAQLQITFNVFVSQLPSVKLWFPALFSSSVLCILATKPTRQQLLHIKLRCGVLISAGVCMLQHNILEHSGEEINLFVDFKDPVKAVTCFKQGLYVTP